MNIRRQPRSVSNLEQLDAYIRSSHGSIQGEYREFVDDGDLDFIDNMSGHYSREGDGFNFTIDEYGHSGSRTVTADTLANGGIGIVVKSRREIPAQASQ